jgi:hypothetical protein
MYFDDIEYKDSPQVWILQVIKNFQDSIELPIEILIKGI